MQDSQQVYRTYQTFHTKQDHIPLLFCDKIPDVLLTVSLQVFPLKHVYIPHRRILVQNRPNLYRLQDCRTQEQLHHARFYL